MSYNIAYLIFGRCCPSYEKFDTSNKDGQSFHRLSNTTLSVIAKMLHSWSSFWSYHPCCKKDNSYNINSIMIKWCFSTNRAYAFDLYLIFMSRTHFEESVGEWIPQIIQLEVLNRQQAHNHWWKDSCRLWYAI
jgi:hypothetical protein